MDILSKLPSLTDDRDTAVAEQVFEVESKRDRIAFHRAKVRNGPVNYKTVTAGQERRAQKRALARETRRARRVQVRNYFETQKLAAAVRGHLQRAGVLSYLGQTEIDRHLQVTSTVWLLQRFGVNVEVDGVETDEVSFAYDDVLKGLRAALKFHGQATGQEGLDIPEDFIVPIYEQGTEPAEVSA